MTLTGTRIDFNDVEGLSRLLRAQMITRKRFSVSIPQRDMANAIYASMKAEVEFRGGMMRLDDTMRDCIWKGAEWLTDGAGKPGLMLAGLNGNGKTTMMRAIGKLIGYMSERELGYNDRKVMRIRSAKEIAQLCCDTATHRHYRQLVTEEMLGIDDLGCEPKEVMRYGMPLTPLEDLLSERYERQRLTVVTTNLTPEELKSHYGARVLGRLRDMMRIIKFSNPSYR